MMKRTISGMIGAGSLAHNRRDFVAENVNQDEATPHLHIDFVPYVINWKGKGMEWIPEFH